MTVRFAVFASGSGTNLEALLDQEEAEGAYRVEAVVTDRPCAAEDRARRRGRPVHRTSFPDRLGPGARLLAALREHRVEGVLLAGFLRLVPAELCRAYRGRILNVHPAPLPAFGGRGMYGRRVHEAVLASGAKVSGPTVHHVVERYDEGRIMAQWPVPVLPEDTPETLAARVLAVEHVLFPEAAAALARAVAHREGPKPFRWPEPGPPSGPGLRAAVRAAFRGEAGLPGGTVRGQAARAVGTVP